VVNTTKQNRNIYNACNYKRIIAQSKNLKAWETTKMYLSEGKTPYAKGDPGI
jgi:hypothetical protein